MSCFVMNAEPLAALANAIETRLNIGYDFWGFDAPDSLYRELMDCKTSCTYYAEPIYRKLYALNVRAYNGRYPSHEEPTDEEAPTINVNAYTITRRPEYRAHTFAVQPWHYQLAKLLDCYLYQTAEDATYKDPLRLAIKEFRDGLCEFIMTHNPQYITLPWGAMAAPYTPDKTGYQRSEETEPLILEPDDWQPDEWATLCKLAGQLPPQDTERIVISGYTLETYIAKKEDGANG